MSKTKGSSDDPQGFADLIGPPPATPPPINLNDERLPAHNVQQAYFARKLVENAMEAVEAAEARLAGLEKRLQRRLQRRKVRSIRGGRRL